MPYSIEMFVPTRDGRSDFQKLRRRKLPQRPRMIAESAACRPAGLIVFDILQLKGADLRSRPLFERRQPLHAHIPLMRPVIRSSNTYKRTANRRFGRSSTAITKGSSGANDAPYLAGPSSAWLKIKNRDYSRRGAVEWHGR